MSYGIRLVVWGEYACWTRPEMKVERVSYDVMTPSGARGILEAIYWKPQFRWVVDRIRVLAPIRFANLRRNELDHPKISVSNKEDMGKDMGIFIEEKRQQRASLLLTDVRYGIEAHVEVLDSQDKDGSTPANPAAKHLDQFHRRLHHGACFHRPYLGCREFPAHFAPVTEGVFPDVPKELMGERDLGYMLHDLEHAHSPAAGWRHACTPACQPRFFRARMVDGVIDVQACLQQTREALRT